MLYLVASNTHHSSDCELFVVAAAGAPARGLFARTARPHALAVRQCERTTESSECGEALGFPDHPLSPHLFPDNFSRSSQVGVWKDPCLTKKSSCLMQ